MQVPVDVDEPTLKEIAARTGGKYYRADQSDTLRSIYAEIDRLEKIEAVVQKYTRTQELFAWAAVPALGLLLLEIVLSHTIWKRLP